MSTEDEQDRQAASALEQIDVTPWGPRDAAQRKRIQDRIAALAEATLNGKPQPPVVEGLSLEEQQEARRRYIHALREHMRAQALAAPKEHHKADPFEDMTAVEALAAVREHVRTQYLGTETHGERR